MARRLVLSTAGLAAAMALAISSAQSGAAAEVEWHPLAAGEYQHVYATSFTPFVPANRHETRAAIDSFLRLDSPGAEERWMDAAGHGLSLRITGGTGDPTTYPTFQRDKQGRWTGGVGPTVAPDRPVVSAENALRYPDTVSAENTTSPTPGQVRDRFWGRTPDGFVKLRQLVGNRFRWQRLPKGSGTTPLQQEQIRIWGGSKAQLDALDSASTATARTAAMLRVLDARERFSGSPMYGLPSQFGMTLDQYRNEYRIRHAVKVLTAAPISPASRRAIVAWLAAQPGAHVTTGVADRSGRVGTRIRFDRGFDRRVGRRVSTAAALLREALEVGLIEGTNVVSGPRSVTVPPHREYRRVYVSVIVDPTSGALLQQEYYERYANTVGLAGFRQHRPTKPGGPTQLELTRGRRVDPARALGGWEAQLVSADRATTFAPRAPVCSDHPEICQ